MPKPSGDTPVEPHQRAILGRIADEVADYRSARQTLLQALGNTWNLFTAAEIHDTATVDTFMRLYYDLDAEDDLRQPGIPAGLASEARLEAAADALEAWALEVRDGGAEG